jgi:exodeoxyribonuclease V alpha subunit
VVERITYQNSDNGYTVARLAEERVATDHQDDADRPRRATSAPSPPSDDNHLVTVVGTLADVTPGELVIVRGWWRNDPKYGWQFAAVDYRTALPATLQGMKKYLGSGLVKGIGPVNAGRIVEHFGEETFAVIDTASERLREVAGIGPVRASRIAAGWAEQRHIREVMAALQGYGISTSLAVRIYKRFGDQSARVIQEQPYRLAREVWGIGFKTADKIAAAVGIARDAPERLQAGALHALGAAVDDGHTLLAEAQLLGQAAALLGLALPGSPAPEAGSRDDPLAQAVAALVATGEVVPAQDAGETERRLALAPFARAESGLASRLLGLAGQTERQPTQAMGEPSRRTRVNQVFEAVNWTVAFGWLAERHGIALAPEQEAAVQMALTQPVAILTGGPGTGKTHTLRALLALAGAKRLSCLLAAPTGRAAKRMEDATGQPAATLHRLLELRPGAPPGRGPDNPLPVDLVVVDEASMLDALLANQLVKAVAPGTHLLLVGDPDQLPSVGAGEVLADLLRAGRFPVTRLSHIFRQGAGSGIATNAQRINAGEVPVFDRAGGTGPGDCFFLSADEPGAAAALVVDLVARRLPARYGFGAGEIQVLSPMHRGDIGVGALNQQLQDRLNPARAWGQEARSGARVYRPGDRVLQLKNDYDLGVFNGDLGTVKAVDPTEQELILALDDGREVRYPFTGLFALTHAYAISVHKAQGAEFPAVVVPLMTTHAALLGRTLLYTAVTRAQRLVVIVGQWKALMLAVRDWRRSPRSTALGGLLTGETRFSWPRTTSAPVPDEGELADGSEDWEGLLTAGPEGDSAEG